MVEEKDYNVELTIKVKTIVSFAPMEGDRPLTLQDAVDNAIGSLFSDEMEGEFANLGFVMAPIVGTATERV